MFDIEQSQLLHEINQIIIGSPQAVIQTINSSDLLEYRSFNCGALARRQ